ncbi:prepilin-type N-terminal cleavage/methylation domain-containing protein [Deefgea piscis]|uniref:Prepilin-type N-terminal cleavage/methylation domain-containing protein n=1 Tax=Deefgea piscis TaxID=2739061 RepID=A0A6M8STV3_9NEIS|nr:prepilin-type N-terminal cleavage/methylation domain-containing protein [Deefgea piscis]QKJ68111.1 prepilin-type N-terminal cleavage/methylation domain-containing protein [Deefgea piscis]
MIKHFGFTLIELMVAMAISLIALLALSELYINTRQTASLQMIQNQVSEDGRYAISMLQRAIAQAGFRADPTVALASDRIAATSNESISIKFTSDGQNQIDCNGSVAAAGATTLVIAKSSSKLQCGTVDWIAPSTSGSGNGTELIDFKILYGIDTGPNLTDGSYGCGSDPGDGSKPRDCIADSYVSSLTGGVTASQIASIKVCLVLRSEKTDTSIVKSAAVKDCSGSDISGSDTDKKLYRMFRSTIVLKNN